MSWAMLFWTVLALLGLLAVFSLCARIGKLRCACRLGLNCGWMAFMPFLSAYLDGRIAQASHRLLNPDQPEGPHW